MPQPIYWPIFPKETWGGVAGRDAGARERRKYAKLLEFDPSTAGGGMMNTEFVFIGEGASRDEVLHWMKEQDLNLDQLDTVVLLDRAAQIFRHRPGGAITLADPEQTLGGAENQAVAFIASRCQPKRKCLKFSINITCEC